MVTGVPPRDHLIECSVKHPRGDRCHQGRSLEDWNELARANWTQARVCPTKQRLRGNRLQIRRAVARLVFQVELILSQATFRVCGQAICAAHVVVALLGIPSESLSRFE